MKYPNRRKHGMKHTRFYSIWERIKTRCNNPNVADYPYYGGRGIKVCDRWLRFQNFRDDMYESYRQHAELFGEADTTIERKDVAKDYEPGNCIWATRKEQGNNKRNNIIVRYKRKRMTLKQAAELAGVPYRKVHDRYTHLKWSITKSLSPSNGR